MRMLPLVACLIVLAACASGRDGGATDRGATDGGAVEDATDGGAVEDATDGGAVEDRTDPAVEDEAPTAPSTSSPSTTGRPDRGCRSVEPGVARFTTRAGGPPIRVRVFVPPSFDGTPLPAVIDWHGLGSSGEQQLSLTGYVDLARTEGFIAVHPTGAPAPGAAATSWELTQLDVPGRDDLAMVDDLIDTLVADHCVDPDRVYSIGMSNGGYFTARLVCERADRIAAATSVAGLTHPDDCHPSRPVPYLAFHGTADEIVPYRGGRSSLQAGPSPPEVEAFFAQVMPEEFAQFAADFGCDPDPGAVPVGDEVIRHDYRGCDGDIPLTFYEITGGGHTWPGSSLGPLLERVLGHTTDEVDATAEGWAFMSRFSLP